MDKASHLLARTVNCVRRFAIKTTTVPFRSIQFQLDKHRDDDDADDDDTAAGCSSSFQRCNLNEVRLG
jgi:hypothetical protein